MELSIRLDKSVNRLDEIDAERPCSLKTLLHASLIASMIAAPPRPHTQSADLPDAGWQATHGGGASPKAPGLAAGRVLSVHCPSLRPEGGRSPAALGQDCS